MKKIDLKLLKLMLISGANNLYNLHYEVDKLNVFPVPDGDTGTNMNLTMMNGIKELNIKELFSFKELGSTFSRGLIMGARGNSGVILSQIFRGFFNPIIDSKNDNLESIDSKILLESLLKAKEFAYKAIMKPVEGTILTIIKDGADKTNENCQNEENILVIFEKLIHYMDLSLKNTPNLLPILKKVGVVDSGGSGLVHIFKGMLYALKHNRAVTINKKISNKNTKFDFSIVEEEFGYCTEVIIKKTDESKVEFELRKVQNEIENMQGKSIVLVEADDLIKLHVHTLKPIKILNYMLSFGPFLNVKVENMNEQAKSHMPTIVNPRNLSNEYAIIACVSGKGSQEYFKKELNVNYIIPYSTKSNPSIDDFLKFIEKCNAKVVYILPNDSNLFLAAEQAKKLEKKSKVYILPTVNIAQGMRAALSFSSGLTHKENYKQMLSEIKNVAFGYISVADRGDIEIDNVKIAKNNYLAAKTPKKESKIKVVASDADFEVTVKKLLLEIIFKSAEIVTIFKGKKTNESEIKIITEILQDKYDLEYEIIQGDQEIYNFLFVVE